MTRPISHMDRVVSFMTRSTSSRSRVISFMTSFICVDGSDHLLHDQDLHRGWVRLSPYRIRIYIVDGWIRRAKDSRQGQQGVHSSRKWIRSPRLTDCTAIEMRASHHPLLSSCTHHCHPAPTTVILSEAKDPTLRRRKSILPLSRATFTVGSFDLRSQDDSS
jgi:hypothetical protein